MLGPTPEPAPSSFSQHAAAVRNRVFLYAAGRMAREEAEDLTHKAMLVLEKRYSEKPEEDLFKLGGRIISFLWLDLCRRRRALDDSKHQRREVMHGWHWLQHHPDGLDEVRARIGRITPDDP